MKSSQSNVDGSDLVLGEFLKAMSEAVDPQAVVASYSERYPERIESLIEMAEFNQILDSSRPKSEMPLPPKKLGEFVLGRYIGGGGMGEIYEAYHERLQRHVAVKIIRRGWTNNEASQRFIREQRVLAQLHQTHIVPIHTAGEEDSIQYYCMPYVNGTSLKHVLDAAFDGSTKRAIRSTSVPELARQIVEAAQDRPVQEAGSLSVNKSIPSNAAISEAQHEKANRILAVREQIVLTQKYYRSVALLMRDVALAIDHAHCSGILHRDLKPENIMVEPNGHAWVIDFGLAALISNRTDKKEIGAFSAGIATHNEGHDVSYNQVAALTVGVGGGTPQYMAPERWDAKPADVASDVWSLGATLYELITLRRAFGGDSSEEIREKILACTPVPPTELAKNLPRDLNAICQKALQKEPTGRYKSAAEMAEDLGRWLRHEPVKASPVSAARRVRLWTKRNPGWATAMSIAVLAMVVTSGVLVAYFRGQATLAERSLLKLQFQRQRLSTHSVGWFDESWAIARKIRATIPKSEERFLAEEAAKLLRDVDAKQTKLFDFNATNICFDPTGKHLLMTAQSRNPDEVVQSAKIWESETDRTTEFPKMHHTGFGPLAFPKDGEPVQLVWDKDAPTNISLWNMKKAELVRRLEFPSAIEGVPISSSISANGELASAILLENVDNALSRRLLIWEASTGLLLVNLSTTAQDVELCPDGSLVATSKEDGEIEIWSVAEKNRISSFSSGHTGVLCMAWGADYLIRTNSTAKGWLLAAGSHGGDLTIWDTKTKIPRSFCRGSRHDLYRLAFSPDGKSLCSVGRSWPAIWDVATGEPVIRLGNRDYMSSVAYSPDGKSIAVGFDAAGFAEPSGGGIDVWELDENRGQQTLRGLVAPIRQLISSSSGRYVAALADNWQLAVWDLKRNQLLHVFETPKGVFVGNTALAFDSENRIFFSAGDEARAWDLMSGKEVFSLKLPPGFMDRLAEDSSGRLLLARQESIDPSALPYGRNVNPAKTPRVCRMRDLLAAEPEKPLYEFHDFPISAIQIHLAPNGKWIAIEGLERESGKYIRAIKLFATSNGKERWAQRSAFTQDTYRTGGFDSNGRFLTIGNDAFRACNVTEAESGNTMRTLDPPASTISPNQDFFVRGGPDLGDGDIYKYSLFRFQDDRKLLNIADADTDPITFQFNSSSSTLMYGREDGTVVCMDIQKVRKKLSEIGLGW